MDIYTSFSDGLCPTTLKIIFINCNKQSIMTSDFLQYYIIIFIQKKVSIDLFDATVILFLAVSKHDKPIAISGHCWYQTLN